jgi:hypothetical protein
MSNYNKKKLLIHLSFIYELNSHSFHSLVSLANLKLYFLEKLLYLSSKELHKIHNLSNAISKYNLQVFIDKDPFSLSSLILIAKLSEFNSLIFFSISFERLFGESSFCSFSLSSFHIFSENGIYIINNLLIYLFYHIYLLKTKKIGNFSSLKKYIKFL